MREGRMMEEKERKDDGGEDGEEMMEEEEREDDGGEDGRR